MHSFVEKRVSNAGRFIRAILWHVCRADDQVQISFGFLAFTRTHGTHRRRLHTVVLGIRWLLQVWKVIRISARTQTTNTPRVVRFQHIMRARVNSYYSTRTRNRICMTGIWQSRQLHSSLCYPHTQTALTPLQDETRAKQPPVAMHTTPDVFVVPEIFNWFSGRLFTSPTSGGGVRLSVEILLWSTAVSWRGKAIRSKCTIRYSLRVVGCVFEFYTCSDIIRRRDAAVKLIHVKFTLYVLMDFLFSWYCFQSRRGSVNTEFIIYAWRFRLYKLATESLQPNTCLQKIYHHCRNRRRTVDK